MKVSVIIPVLNEAESIGKVLDAIPQNKVHEVVVVDNGSTDATVMIARSKGAKVVHEARRGYGRACLIGLRTVDHPDAVVFLDGDYSDVPEELPQLLAPLERGEADFVLGSRTLGHWERGAIHPEVLWRNRVACLLMRLLFQKRYTDIGTFRAIRYSVLENLRMHDSSYGWHLEMQLKAAKKKVRSLEVPVRYRVRIGQSKRSGVSQGSAAITFKTFWMIFRNLLP